MACCGGNDEIAKKVSEKDSAHCIYDDRHGTYKVQEPSFIGGSKTSKSGPQPFRTKGGK